MGLCLARLALAEPMPGGADRDDLARRRSVRGVTIPDEESAELKALRRFESERFGAARRRWLGDEGLGRELPARPARYATLALPDVAVRWDPRLVAYLDFYKNERRGRSIMAGWLRAQGRYRERIEEALERHHLPHALLYVAMIESGYDPLDRSSAGAAGLWQFMPEGGRIYGLRIDHWVDERNDPDKATEAVMRYFADLHARFGSWHLALAAFNAGYGAVLSSVHKYNTNDYWVLASLEDGLPFETVQYVPKALAAAIVGDNRAAFGFGDVEPLAPSEPDRVEVPTSTSIEAIAQAAGVGASEVAALNTELRRGRTPPERWTVRLPRGAGPRFLERFPRHVERLAPHTLRGGERLEAIARAHHVSVKELRRLNSIRDLAELRPGMILLVPSTGGPPPKIEAEAEAGETIVALPDAAMNIEGRKRLFYRVAPGDGLDEVARLLGTTEAELCAWNRLDVDAHLVGGMILQAWVDPAADTGIAALDPAHLKLVTVGTEDFFDTVEARRGRKRIQHEVKRGETWKSIAAHYHLAEGDLERINRMGRTNELGVGQKLTIYVPMTARDREELKRTPPASAPEPVGDDPELDGAALAASPGPAVHGSGTKVDVDDVPTSGAPAAAPCDDPAIARPPAGEPSRPETGALPLPRLPLAHAR